MTVADIDMYRYLNEFRENTLGVDVNAELAKWPLVKAIVDRVAANPDIATYVSKRASSDW
jgi:glutathione S-transferase